MKLSGLHFLLTYQCTFECDHCFAWGSPWQQGVFTLEKIRHVLQQAIETESIQSVYFEGGEPFLYYPVLLQGIQEAVKMGFKAGIVTNSYWATNEEDALAWLKPFAGLLENLTISSDLFHYSEMVSQQAENARRAAEKLGIPIGCISVARPEATDPSNASKGMLPEGLSGVMYRGRAAEKLVHLASRQEWETFTACPHEDLREPGRVHLDPLGYLHICQGLALGNCFTQPLRELCEGYDPDRHPVIGPLLTGGPAELARRYQIPVEPGYADACHLCYETRRALRPQFPETLAPDQMYGVFEEAD